MLKRLLFLTVYLSLSTNPLFAQETNTAGINAFKSSQYQKAEQLLLTEADAGNTASMVYLARFYSITDTGKLDYQKSLTLLNKAAKANEPTAYYWLGLAYLSGRGVSPNFEKAKTNLEIAGKQGQPRAYFSLGNAYMKGELVAKSPKNAVHYYQAGAAKGDQASRMTLANMYKEGDGIPENPVRALELYKAYYAAEKAAGRNDDYGIGKSTIEQAEKAVAFWKHLQKTARFNYQGTLPACDKSKELWDNCFGIRLVKNSAKGARYEGEFKNDLAHGNGGMYWPSGEFYEGEFNEGIRYGLGSYTFKDGVKLAGQWRGLLNGYGQEIDADGNVIYNGEYRNGKRFTEADKKEAKLQQARDKCEQQIRRKYEFTNTDKYGNRTSQKFEVLNYGYNLETHQSQYYGFGNNTVLVFPSVMFNNGNMIRGNPTGYCVIRPSTYLKSNDIIDVEVRTK